MKMGFYKCEKCGQIIAIVNETAAPIICCGQEMTKIVPNTNDAAQEKHVPVWSVQDGVVEVTVGSVDHPMTEAHYIQWIALQTKAGNQRKVLSPADAPKAVFYIASDDEVEAVYAYCNLHSLWVG